VSRTAFSLGLFAAMLVAPDALAQMAGRDENNWDGGYQIVAKRRSDVTLGLSTGLIVGSASGYPNEVEKIDNPAYESSTGLGFGGGAAIWLGGALRDWFNFSVGGAGGNLEGSGTKASIGAFIFRVEAFPFFTSSQGNALQDFGVAGTFGLGVVTLEEGGEETAEGGAMALTSIGVFHESLRFGHFTLGPTLEYSYFFSQTLDMHAGMLGARLAFYGGPG
jgi:hypothetical protein